MVLQNAYHEAESAYREAEPAYREAEPAYREAEPAYREAQPAYREAEKDWAPAEPAETPARTDARKMAEALDGWRPSAEEQQVVRAANGAFLSRYAAGVIGGFAGGWLLARGRGLGTLPSVAIIGGCALCGEIAGRTSAKQAASRILSERLPADSRLRTILASQSLIRDNGAARPSGQPESDWSQSVNNNDRDDDDDELDEKPRPEEPQLAGWNRVRAQNAQTAWDRLRLQHDLAERQSNGRER